MSHNNFLFDHDGRFTADFESMYRAEEAEAFDAWNQDRMSLYKNIDLIVTQQYNFSTILDLGCGKGYFTGLLKRRNNRVRGVDISPTAIERAKARHPDVEFAVCDVSKADELQAQFDDLRSVDLVVARALLYGSSTFQMELNRFPRGAAIR